MEKRQKITLLFWLCLSLFVCIESWRLGLGSFNAPGPGFLPFGASLAILLLSLFLFLKERGRKLVGKAAPIFRGKKIRNVIYILGGIFAFPLLLNRLGFFLCTLLFMGFCLKIIVPQKWRVVLGMSIGVTIISYLLFDAWLTIQLPKGTWVNQLLKLASPLWK
jgi:hypothetical protein